MWTNLASKVGTQDWSGALEKLGNAVAPPPGVDDEYEEEEYDDDEDDEYDEDEGEDDRPTTFGFVGLLARALDKGHAEHQEAAEEEDEEANDLEPPMDQIQDETTNRTPIGASESPSHTKLKYSQSDATQAIKKEITINPPDSQTQNPCTDSGPSLLEASPRPATLNEAQATDEDPQIERKHTVGKTKNERGNTDEAIQLGKGQNFTPSPIPHNQKQSSPTASTPFEGHSIESESKSQQAEPPPLCSMIRLNGSVESNPVFLAPKSQVPSNSQAVLLQEAEEKIRALQRLLTEESEKYKQMNENLIVQFQKKEARLLEASAEEHQHVLKETEHRHKAEIHLMEMRLAAEKQHFLDSQLELRHQIEQNKKREERAKQEIEKISQQQRSTVAQFSLQEQRSLRLVEEKVAQTMALLDERDDLISILKEKVKLLESTMNERQEGADEAEQELEELQTENEELQDKMDQLQGVCFDHQRKIAILEDEAAKLGPLQMELTLVREERDRERAKNQSVAQSTMTSHSVLESERDSAVAEVRGLKQELAAAFADLDVLRADRARLLTANNNLQAALEAFQDERHAEMKIMEEQRLESEAAIYAAHAAAVEIIQQTHAEDIRRVHVVAEQATKEALEQRDDITVTLKKLQAEHFQTRRSLDEAIHRLQTSQEDVIDRTLMKNILLEWCMMKEKEKRQQVLELMASLLHFTDEEKESVHLTHLDIDSMRSKVVGAIAAPLPPSKAILEQLEGENVSEKWISFLMAESEGDC